MTEAIKHALFGATAALSLAVVWAVIGQTTQVVTGLL